MLLMEPATFSNDPEQTILGVKQRNSPAPIVTKKYLDGLLPFRVIFWSLGPLIHLLLPIMRGQCMCLRLRKMSKLEHACFTSYASSNGLILHVLSHNTTFQES
jgi:hypothetical protein